MSTSLTVAIVIIVVAVAGYGLFKLNQSSDWVAVEGKILTAEIEPVYRSVLQQGAMGDRTIDYKLTIKYQYYVNDVVYIGDTLTAGLPNVLGSKVDADQLLTQYREGAKVEVFYNAKNPQQAALITGKSFPIVAIVIIGLMIALIGSGIVWLLNSKLLAD